MKLILCLTLIWALFSTDEALVCQQCLGSSCGSPPSFTCPTESTRCFTSQTLSTGASGQTLQEVKGCTAPSLCLSEGINTIAFSINGFSAVIDFKCCSTDSCNAETLPAPQTPMNNSFQCCGDSNCTSTVQCRGEENHCFQGTAVIGGSTSAFGCASKNICDALSSGWSLFFNTSDTSCCDTSFCNTDITTTTAPTGASTTTNTAASSCRVQLGIIHLLLGPMIFILL